MNTVSPSAFAEAVLDTSHLHDAPSGSHERFSPPVSIGVRIVGLADGIGVTKSLFFVPVFNVGSAALF